MKSAESWFPENENTSSNVSSDNNLSLNLIEQASIWCEIILSCFFQKH